MIPILTPIFALAPTQLAPAAPTQVPRLQLVEPAQLKDIVIRTRFEPEIRPTWQLPIAQFAEEGARTVEISPSKILLRFGNVGRGASNEPVKLSDYLARGTSAGDLLVNRNELIGFRGQACVAPNGIEQPFDFNPVVVGGGPLLAIVATGFGTSVSLVEGSDGVRLFGNKFGMRVNFRAQPMDRAIKNELLDVDALLVVLVPLKKETLSCASRAAKLDFGRIDGLATGEHLPTLRINEYAFPEVNLAGYRRDATRTISAILTTLNFTENLKPDAKELAGLVPRLEAVYSHVQR